MRSLDPRFLIIGIGCAALIGCGSKNKVKLEPVKQSWVVSEVEDFRSRRKVPAAMAELALGRLNLSEKGEYGWAERTGKNGTYEFVDLILPEKSGTVKKLKLTGLHMDGDTGPLFDSIELSDLLIQDYTGNPVVKIDQARLNFSEELLKDISSSGPDIGIDEIFGDLIALEMEPLLSSSAYANGLEITFSSQLKLNVGFAGWAPEEGVDRASILAENVTFKPPETLTAALPSLKLDRLSLANLDTFGLDADAYQDLSALNPFDPGVDGLIIDNLEFDFDGLSIDLPSLKSGLSGNVKGKYSNQADMPELSLKFERAPENFALAQLWSLYEQMGYEQLNLSWRAKINLDAKRDVVEVDEYDITLEDGFVLKLDYHMDGYKKFVSGLIDYQKKLFLQDESITSGELTYPARLEEAMSELKVHGFQLELDDNSLREKVLEQMAQGQDVSIDVVTQQAKGFAMMMTLGVNNDYLSILAEDFALSAQSFITDGGRLRFSANPETPFSIPEAMRQYEAFQIAKLGKGSQENSGEDEAAGEPLSINDIFGPLKADFEHIAD